MVLLVDFYLEGMLSKVFKSLKYENNTERSKKLGERTCHVLGTGLAQGDKVSVGKQQRQGWQSIPKGITYGTAWSCHKYTHIIVVCVYICSFIGFQFKEQRSDKGRAEGKGEKHL